MPYIRFAVLALLAVILFSNAAVSLKTGLFSALNRGANEEKLELENDSLKAELYICENLQSEKTEDGGWNYISAKVFSTYPFNNQNFLGITAGSDAGIQKGDAVSSAPGVLLGQISDVKENTALVRTIFDKDFTAAVKIGDGKISALLKGGLPPTLEMIEKNSIVKSGDVVYNADPNFPYGFKIGEAQISSGANQAGPFKNAVLKINYNPAVLDEILVVSNFKPLKIK